LYWKVCFLKSAGAYLTLHAITVHSIQDSWKNSQMAQSMSITGEVLSTTMMKNTAGALGVAWDCAQVKEAKGLPIRRGGPVWAHHAAGSWMATNDVIMIFVLQRLESLL
jgi:hypothetical protein